MTQPTIQNFDVPADNDRDIVLTVDSSVPNDTLAGAAVYWRAYQQQFGAPIPNIPPVIEKSSISGGGIVILESPPMTFVVTLTKIDLEDLLRNYYHEATIVRSDDTIVTTELGIMTVTATENRIS